MRLSRFATPLLAVALFLTSGCATIFTGTDDSITFNSEPAGATVMIDGMAVGQTPVTVEVDRPGLDDTDVSVQLEGYETRRFELDKEFNVISILNVFFWPGFVVDVLTGALFKHDKNTYSVDLDTGIVSFNLEELPRGADGQYLLPDTDEQIAVTDAQSGLTLLFK